MILAIDQGTSGTTCLVVDAELAVLGRGYRPLVTHFPQPGLVEQDPEAIWQSVLDAAADAVADAGVAAGDLRAIGITNQRETTVLWERALLAARRACARLAGPPHGRALRPAPTRVDPRAQRARARSLLLREQARVAARADPAGT